MGSATLDVSVCICTYNRRDSLLEALRSLAAARIPEEARHEVLVIDNNSSDGTAEAVAGLDEARLPLRYVQETRQGLSHARNRAIIEAKGRVIAFLDDDVVVDADWLANLLRAFDAEPRPAAVGGPARLPADFPRPPWWHEEFNGVAGHFDRGGAALRSDDDYRGMIGIGANLAFDGRVFEEHGLFRTDLGRAGTSLAMGEELELLDRLRRDDALLVYDPAVVVEHRPDLARITRSYLRRWYFRFGEWRYEVDRERQAVRLLGIPRWRLRQLGEDGARWLRALLRRSRPEAFLHELNIVAFGGYLKRGWKLPWP